MFSKSKYDVMESINTKSSMSLLLLAGKVYKDLKLYENKKISKQEFDNRFKNNVTTGIPSIKAICHIGYENSKDLVEVGEEELYRYMKNEGLTREQFDSNYKMMINTYVRLLLAFSIVEEEKLDIYSIMTPGILLSLVKGDFSGLKELRDQVGIKISSNNKSLFDKLVSKDFDVSSLSNIDIKQLESVHSKYMERNINNKVTGTYDKSKTLKYAKSLGKKKSVFEL